MSVVHGARLCHLSLREVGFIIEGDEKDTIERSHQNLNTLRILVPFEK